MPSFSLRGAITLNRQIDILLAVAILILSTLACNAVSRQTGPGPAPTQIIEAGSTQSEDNLPHTEAEVPRVAVEEAKAALDSGAAIIVDVRSAEAYEMGHVAGAMHIPLGEIEANPTGLDLEKDQWIITYCT